MVTDVTSVSYSLCMVGFINVSKGYRGERIKYFTYDVKKEKKETEQGKVLGSTFNDFVSNQFSGRCKSSIEFLKTINYKSIDS